MVLFFLATANAYAMRFSFDQSTGEPYGEFDFSMPVAVMAIATVAGSFLIISERRKGRGIWFSGSEWLK